MSNKRLIIIDVMQGIAMFLVVLGHHLFNFMPHWYGQLFKWISVNCFGIYLLHMFFVQAGATIITRLPFGIPSWGYIAYLLISTTVSICASAIFWNKICTKNIFKRTNTTGAV